ncbi:hypothetical protein ACGE24_00070 [Corynebacterium kroppenstedtii]|uniref:hypothetical protein n=1 Tax=Corynebacterium sp. PCR 32 TaxID=3351342 RepID=UPI0030A4D44E
MLNKKTLVTLAGTMVAVVAPLTSPIASATPVTPTPDQDKHRSTFVDTDKCDPAADATRHPWEQWVTDEWDRYNGTNSFTNRSDRPIQYSLEVTEGVNESVKAMSSGNMWDTFLYGVKARYGIVEVSQWSVGDKLGPVTVNPGETVRADYGVHMKSFIGRVRTCDKNSKTWRGEPYFGEYNGKGPSTRFVVWHKTTKDGEQRSQWAPVTGNSGDGGPASASIND